MVWMRWAVLVAARRMSVTAEPLCSPDSFSVAKPPAEVWGGACGANPAGCADG